MNSDPSRFHGCRIICRLTNPNKIRDIMLFTLLKTPYKVSSKKNQIKKIQKIPQRTNERSSHLERQK